MDRRMGWGGVGGVVVAVAVSVVCGGQWGSAGQEPSSSQWHSSDELLQDGQVSAPEPILEVQFQYDAEATPSLSLKKIHVKHGHAPQYEPLDAGYVLTLLDESGNALSTLTFQIPNVVFNPPPRPGEAPGEGPLVLTRMDFALTVPMVTGAVELRVTDPQGVLVIQESLRNAPVQDNQPNFRSLQRQNSLPGSQLPRRRSRFAWFADWLMETAEAATSDGTVLDVMFVGDNYAAGDLAMFHQDVDRAVAHMMTYEPYVSRASQVLFHSVETRRWISAASMTPR